MKEVQAAAGQCMDSSDWWKTEARLWLEMLFIELVWKACIKCDLAVGMVPQQPAFPIISAQTAGAAAPLFPLGMDRNPLAFKGAQLIIK